MFCSTKVTDKRTETQGAYRDKICSNHTLTADLDSRHAKSAELLVRNSELPPVKSRFFTLYEVLVRMWDNRNSTQCKTAHSGKRLTLLLS